MYSSQAIFKKLSDSGYTPPPFLSMKVQKCVNKVSIPDIRNLSDPSLGHFGLREKRIYLFRRILRILFTLLFGHVFDRHMIMF